MTLVTSVELVDQMIRLAVKAEHELDFERLCVLCMHMHM